MTHVALALTADMAAHTLAGTATLTVEGRPDAREVVLDTRGLAVSGRRRRGRPRARLFDAARATRSSARP